MRAAIACLLLAACASVAAGRPPPERLAGCWMQRSGVNATTMRWLRDPAQPGVLNGSKLVYGVGGVTARARYQLLPEGEGWRLCELDTTGAQQQCWAVAEGDGGSLEGGRAFIDAYGSRLRVVVIGDGPERDIFHGDRDGCD